MSQLLRTLFMIMTEQTANVLLSRAVEKRFKFSKSHFIFSSLLQIITLKS